MTLPSLPQRLVAPEPGWTAYADVVVVGSGIAGLTAARHASRTGTVLLVTKALLDDGSTRWAQGGIAAALGHGDSPEQHLWDTLTAGVGLCDEEAVRTLVQEGPGAVRDLIALGAQFDRDPDGGVALTREGGHLRDRIAHAGGDATGAEVSRALLAALKAAGGIEVIEHALVLDLLLDADGRAAGVTLHVMGEGQRDGVGAVRCRAVVLATGGLGQVYASTTNPEVSTGDGVAVALRAGAEATDLEFIQFHPTVLWLGPDAGGQQPLVSEAVRGEGAFLVDRAGRRFMQGVHPLADLAPRDVVAKATTRLMLETGADHVYLDGRHLGERTWRRRFPTITASCLDHGIDPARDLVPVVPAAHYASGGVRTDRWGRTSVPGLYACGEVACTGVHGANRLASNSLLEGLVFARRIGADLERSPRAAAPPVDRAASSPYDSASDSVHRTPPPRDHAETQTRERLDPVRDPRPAGLIAAEAADAARRAMTEGAGVLRSRDSLTAAWRRLGAALTDLAGVQPCTESWEAANLLTVAFTLTAAAQERTETRGSHWREDFPEPDDRRWLGHITATLRDGRVETAYLAAPARTKGDP